MGFNLLHVFLSFFLASSVLVNSQSSAGSGYTGYSFELYGDDDSVVYATDDTTPNVSTTNPPPDVYLNASVFVGEIDITVQNLSAKINLDAQVLQLLQFNAGVDVSIDRVQLLIQNVTAKVLLEARLENVLLMINDTLNSIDLNPIIATLGEDVGDLVNSTVGGLTGSSGSSSVAKRSYDLAHNILYSVNDYSGNTHTNRILSQNGSIIDQFLDNDGNIQGQNTVGSYSQDMTFNGHNQSVTMSDGQAASELQYVYAPFAGLSVVSGIYVNGGGAVIATQVISEGYGGGSSTIGD